MSNLLTNPLESYPKMIRCDLCYLDIHHRNVYITHPSGKKYHIECVSLKNPGCCFYCCSTINLKIPYYIWYNAMVCTNCICNTGVTGYSETPKIMNLASNAPAYSDIEDTFNQHAPRWDLLDSISQEDIDLLCYENFEEFPEYSFV